MAWHQAVKQRQTWRKEKEGDSQNHETDFITKMMSEFVLIAEVIKGNLEKEKNPRLLQ